MATQSHPTPLARLPLLRTLAENWWLLLLRGIASIVFGVLAFVWPGLTLVALIFLWGAYAIADGGVALWAGISGKGGEIAPAGGSPLLVLLVSSPGWWHLCRPA
jgi:uncharacterized membrane protein HdeD (DUF308 family)